MITEVIDRIGVTLRKEKGFNGAGVSNGVLGLSMFYYYQYLYSKKDFFLKETIEVLEKGLEMLDENYKSILPQNDIVEIGLYVQFLYEKEILDKSTNSLLLEFDDLIEEILKERIANEDLDAITGVFKPLNYIIKRKKKENKYIKKVVELIERKAIIERNSAFWRFKLRSPKNPKIELGLNHGVSGVISGLLNFYNNNIEKKKTRRLIVLGLQFLEKQINKEKICWFPQEANSIDFSLYQNLSYGDIGIGFVFYNAGRIFEEEKWKVLGLSIIENAANYRDDLGEYVRDANLIYGASGLYSFFNYINNVNPNSKFLEAKEYWLEKIIEKGSNNTVWAGYNTYYNGVYDFAQLGFTQGLCGIGISLISNEVNNNDYLKFLNF